MQADPTRQIKLLLSAREAARALSVCEKTLWSYTQPRGPIPSLTIGSRRLYAVADLEAWITAQKGGRDHDAQ